MLALYFIVVPILAAFSGLLVSDANIRSGQYSQGDKYAVPSGSQLLPASV
jgi:hypothetical protein